jgi:hypothetical protein
LSWMTNTSAPLAGDIRVGGTIPFPGSSSTTDRYPGVVPR